MIHVQSIARLVAIGAYVASSALAGIMVRGAGADLGELAPLRTATVVALLVGCLAGAVGFLSLATWARVATLVGLGLCMTFSAISTDSDLSGDSGRPVAVLASVLAWAGFVVTSAALASTRR